MTPHMFWLLLADRNGHQAALRFNPITKLWERFVPEYGGGRWEPFLEQDWPAMGSPIMFQLGSANDRRSAEHQGE